LNNGNQYRVIATAQCCGTEPISYASISANLSVLSVNQSFYISSQPQNTPIANNSVILNIVAKAREVRGVDRVVIRDGDAIGVLLTRLGAHESVLAWEERRMRREVRATANRLANFDDANLRRSARAAVAAAARVQRAMEILGPEIPDHLKEAGELRISHGQASLEELGSLATPPMTKDAIAGRIRRLLAMADKRAAELGIPDTEAGLSPDLLGE
jgi:DNA-binding protein WhiA